MPNGSAKSTHLKKTTSPNYLPACKPPRGKARRLGTIFSKSASKSNPKTREKRRYPLHFLGSIIDDEVVPLTFYHKSDIENISDDFLLDFKKQFGKQ